MIKINVTFKLQKCADNGGFIFNFDNSLPFKLFKVTLKGGEYINNDDVLLAIKQQFNIDADCVDGDCTFEKESYTALLSDADKKHYIVIIDDIQYSF